MQGSGNRLRLSDHCLFETCVAPMAQLLPFCGWRFDLSQVGALHEVTAPPTYDIDQDLQRVLYRRHPCNVVRLVRSRGEPGDTSSADRVIRGDDFLTLWKKKACCFENMTTVSTSVKPSVRRIYQPLPREYMTRSLLPELRSSPVWQHLTIP